LSFDEIVVRPNQLLTVNVVAVTLALLSIIPVYLAQRISADPTGGRTGAEES
jgi:putative spermidine/putrescine transport system permease protein